MLGDNDSVFTAPAVDDDQPDPQTEREAEVHRLKVNALGVVGDYNLHGLHERQEAKLADLHTLREQQAEQARFVRQLTLNQETAKLDALAEMESQENYVPGKNEEQRRRQRDSWLAAHDGYRQQVRVVQAAEAREDVLDLDRHRVEDELSSLKSLIQIRIAELRLISSFVGR